MRVKPEYYRDEFRNAAAAERWAEFTRREVKASGRPYNFRAKVAKRFQGWLSKYDRLINDTGGIPVQFWPEWLDDPEAFVTWVLNELNGVEADDFVIRRDDPKAGFVPNNLSVYRH